MILFTSFFCAETVIKFSRSNISTWNQNSTNPYQNIGCSKSHFIATLMPDTSIVSRDLILILCNPGLITESFMTIFLA